MCKTCGSVPVSGETKAPPPSALPGEAGFTWLEYVGPDARTEFGPVTGARYPFWEANPRYVDARDAAAMLTWQANDRALFVRRAHG